MPTLLTALFGVLVALNLLDGASTWYFVRPDHYGREANPVARAMFRRFGILPGIILAEFLWIGFISGVFFGLASHPAWQLPLTVAFAFGCGVFATIVRGNLSYCLELRRRKRSGKDKGSQR